MGGSTMKKILGLYVFSFVLMFLFSSTFIDFNNAHAAEKLRNPTKSGIKAKARKAGENGLARWESLSPEQQQYVKEEAKVRGKEAAITGEEYWNSLSVEEQQQTIERSKEGIGKARKKWQSLPE